MQFRAHRGEWFHRSESQGRLVIRAFCWFALLALALPATGQDPSLNTRLLAAARAGDQAGVQRAIADGATVNARNRLGETALVIALKGNRPALALQMIDAGTDVNLAAANGLWLLLLLTSGMLAPLSKLPGALQGIAKALPAAALASALHDALGAGTAVPGWAWLVLAAWAVGAPLVAAAAFRWE